MTIIAPAVAGDIGVRRQVRLNGVDDINGNTGVVTHIWLFGEPAATLTSTVIDAAGRIIEFQLGEDSGGWLASATPGMYLLEYVVSFVGREMTWPEGDPDTIFIRSQGG